MYGIIFIVSGQMRARLGPVRLASLLQMPFNYWATKLLEGFVVCVTNGMSFV